MNYEQKKIGITVISVLLFFMLYIAFGRKKEPKDDFVSKSERSDIKSRLDALRTKRKDEKEALHTVSFYEEEIGHSSKKKSADSISLVEEEKTQQVSPIKTPTSVKTKQSSPKKEEKIDHQKDDLTEKREDNNERARLIQNAWNNDRQNTRAEANDASSNYFEAVVHGTQEISNGGVLLIRTKEKIEHSGHTILPNTLISAHATFSKNRVEVKVQSVKTKGKIIPLSFIVYASDGLMGLPVHYDAKKEIMDSEISKEVFDAIEDETNKLSKGIGSLTTGIVKGVKRERESKVTILHNTALYLKSL